MPRPYKRYSDCAAKMQAKVIAKAKAQADTVAFVPKQKPSRSKELADEHNEYARAYTRRIVEEDFEGIEAAAARGFGLGQSTLHDFLAGTKGAGFQMLDAIAVYAKIPIDALIGRAVTYEPPLNQEPNWDKVRAETIAMHPEIPVDCIDDVGKGSFTSDVKRLLDEPFLSNLAKEVAGARARVAVKKRRA